ncbi:MAG: DUF3828 domain-containing protein [Patescibacteria group bacterium]|nr:DUF3828 domain-containing protein [Patescibacteria group bacterium]
MKKNLITIISTVLVASALIVGGSYALKNEIFFGESPEKNAAKFYEQWIAYEGNPMVDRIYYQNDLITENFSAKVDAIIESFLTGQAGGYDPVLCAQDVPAGFELGKAQINGDTAEIFLTEFFSGGNKTILVEMKKEKGEWLINNVQCQAGSAENNFNETGNLVYRDNAWKLVYEKPGKPALTVDLEFGSDCVCYPGDGRENPCRPTLWEEGYRATVSGKRDGDTIETASLFLQVPSPILPPDKAFGEGESFCVDRCGDGICDEVVCLAQGCPCPETSQSCPADCQ